MPEGESGNVLRRAQRAGRTKRASQLVRAMPLKDARARGRQEAKKGGREGGREGGKEVGREGGR